MLNPSRSRAGKTAETESGRILPVWKYRKYPFLEKRSGSKDPGGSISGRTEKGGHYIPALKIFGEKEIQERHYHLLMKEAEKADFSQKIRILYAVSRSMKFTKKCFDGKTYDVLEQECFSQIQKEIASQTQLTGNSGYTIAKEQVKVNLPVRVNWGGGWSDTPPYCNEHGGTVLNAAILLRGCEPIEVEIRKIPELHIELASTDTGAYGTAESAEEIQDCHNPYDPFALHKAAIIACGILPLEEKADLKKVLEKWAADSTFHVRQRRSQRIRPWNKQYPCRSLR